jgi:glycosyltransferase involved in cell wall biosynthesis
MVIPSTERRGMSLPFFSICIPQHNRTGILIEALKELERQTFRSFEVCISEDCSTDGRQQELVDYLQASNLSFVYRPTEKNLRYDANLRAAISLAQGDYCILFGNDDCIQDETTLQFLHDFISGHDKVGVVIGNFADWADGSVTERVRQTKNRPGTPLTAVLHFRNLAFVSGLTVRREAVQALASDRWDGSEMYQMFTFCRIMASGWNLLETTRSLARKDAKSADDFVDSFAQRERLHPCPIIERHLPFMQIGRVVADAVHPYQHEPKGRAERELIFRQLYCFTYPFWLFEYRQVQSWNYAAGIALGMRPRNVVRTVDVGWAGRLRLRLLWLAICTVGLLAPVSLFHRLRERLYRISKSFGS